LSPRERAAIAIAIIDNNFSDYSVNYFDFIPQSISLYLLHLYDNNQWTPSAPPPPSVAPQYKSVSKLFIYNRLGSWILQK